MESPEDCNECDEIWDAAGWTRCPRCQVTELRARVAELETALLACEHEALTGRECGETVVAHVERVMGKPPRPSVGTPGRQYDPTARHDPLTCIHGIFDREPCGQCEAVAVPLGPPLQFSAPPGPFEEIDQRTNEASPVGLHDLVTIPGRVVETACENGGRRLVRVEYSAKGSDRFHMWFEAWQVHRTETAVPAGIDLAPLAQDWLEKWVYNNDEHGPNLLLPLVDLLAEAILATRTGSTSDG